MFFLEISGSLRKVDFSYCSIATNSAGCLTIEGNLLKPGPFGRIVFGIALWFCSFAISRDIFWLHKESREIVTAKNKIMRNFIRAMTPFWLRLHFLDCTRRDTPMYSRSLERKKVQAFCPLQIFLSGIRTT